MSPKELKFRQQADEVDYACKARFAISFLTDGYPVKLAVLIRPKDPDTVDSAQKFLLRLVKDLAPQGELVGEIQPQGNQLQALIHPRSPSLHS